MENDNKVPDDKEKFCHKCNTWKSLKDFYRRSKKSNYYAGYCKKCMNDKSQYDRIVCPHCRQRIFFFGVGLDGKLVKQKSDFIKKLTKDVTAKLNKKKSYKEKITKNDLKNLFDED